MEGPTSDLPWKSLPIKVGHLQLGSSVPCERPTIVRRYGGKYLAIFKVKPQPIKIVEGAAPAPDGMVVFAFPSIEAIQGFVESPEYAPFRKARSEATESTFFAFENDNNAPQFAA